MSKVRRISALSDYVKSLTFELNLLVSDSRIDSSDSNYLRQPDDLDLCITFRVEDEEIPTIIIQSANPRILTRLSTVSLYEIEKLLKKPSVSGFSGITRVLF